MKTTATLIATLMLGVASCAYAQGGPGEGLGGGGGAGPAGPVGVGPGGGGSDGPGAGGPSGGGGGEGPGVLGGPGGGEGRGGDGPGPAAREGRSESGAEAPAPSRAAELPGRQRGDRQKSAGDASEKRGSRGDADAKPSRADRKDDAGDKSSESAAEKAAESVKPDAKSATKEAETGVRDKAGDASKGAPDTAEKAPDTADKKDADPQRAEKAERAKDVDLSGDKRDRVQGAFRDKGDFKRRTDVDIDISIGRRLPRHWHFVPVPITVIEIVPEYRDYVFVYVEDEYVICDPVTYEIVAVIPAGGGGRTYAGGGSGDRECSTGLRLSEDQRELILQSVRLGREVDVSDLEVGWSVPQDIELEKFPTAVLSEAGELAACRYFIADDQLAIVDPDDDKVVLLIDKS